MAVKANGSTARLLPPTAPEPGLRDAALSDPPLRGFAAGAGSRLGATNFQALVQFLTHPTQSNPRLCPPASRRKDRSRPGIGGADWQKALDDIDAQYWKESEERAKAVRAIAFWIEPLRHDIRRRVSDLLARNYRPDRFLPHPTRRQRYLPPLGLPPPRSVNAVGQLDALRALSQQQVDTLSPMQLKKLVTQATARGSENPMRVAEVGAHQRHQRSGGSGRNADGYGGRCNSLACRVPIHGRNPNAPPWLTQASFAQHLRR